MSHRPLTPHVPAPLQEYASPDFKIGNNEEYPTVFIKDKKNPRVKKTVSEVYMIGSSVLNHSIINPIVAKIYCYLMNKNNDVCIKKENEKFQQILNKRKDDIKKNITNSTYIRLFRAYKEDLLDAVIDLTTLVNTPEPLTDEEVASTILMTHHNNDNGNGKEPSQVMTPLRTVPIKRPATPNSSPRPSQMPKRTGGGKSKKTKKKYSKKIRK